MRACGVRRGGGVLDQIGGYVISGDRPGLLFSHADSTRLLVSDGQNGRQTFTAPAGSLLDATSVDDRLYAIIRTGDAVGLWTADLATTRAR